MQKAEAKTWRVTAQTHKPRRAMESGRSRPNAECGARALRAAKISRRRTPRSFQTASMPLLSELWFLAVRFRQIGRPAGAETGPLALNSTVAHPLPSSPLVPYGALERERIGRSGSTGSLSERELSNVSL